MNWRLVGIVAGIVVAAAGLVWSFGIGAGMALGDTSGADASAYVRLVPPVALIAAGMALFAVSMTVRNRAD